MFEDILNAVKEHVGGGTNGQTTDAQHQDIAAHIHDVIQQETSGGIGGLVSQFTHSLGSGNILTGAVTGGLVNSLVSKFGLPSAVSGALVGALPGILKKYTDQPAAVPATPGTTPAAQ